MILPARRLRRLIPTCLTVAGFLFCSVGCARGPDPASYRIVSVDVEVGGKVHNVQAAVVTSQFVQSAGIPEGNFSRNAFELAPGDPSADHPILVSPRLEALVGQDLSAGSCVFVAGACRRVAGMTPESFDQPTGTLLWTAADLAGIAVQLKEFRTHHELLVGRAAELCGAPALPTQANPQSARLPVLFVRRGDSDLPGFGPAAAIELKGNAAERDWVVTSWHLGSQDPFEPPSSRLPRLARFRPATLACISGRKLPVPGRTMTIRIAGGEQRSEAVYTVEWDVRLVSLDSGELVAHKVFRDVPEFKAWQSNPADRNFIVYGEGEQYGNPREDAMSWIRSVVK